MTTELLTTNEVALRLGVRRETVYAYVSRGLLARDPASGHHRSLFAADAVERLAGRARRTGRAGALEVVVDTRMTWLDPAGRLFYRGLDVTELARFRSFEQVAGLLWDGDAGAPWTLVGDDQRLVRALVAKLPERATAADRITVGLAGLAASDQRRGGRRPADVRLAGARILAAALTALEPRDPEGDDPPNAASRLWWALREDGQGPRPAQLAALNAALILLADHELAASTLAGRVAASAWADPYRVVIAALATLGGVLHGGATVAAAALLAEVREPSDAFTVLERRLADGGTIPGFGHRIYRHRDPRAADLLHRVAGVRDARSDRAEVVSAVLDAAMALELPAPNVDLGLAALTDVSGLRDDAAATIFIVARIVGVLGHAIEEYPHRLRFRPRAHYVGPVPVT